MPTVLNPINYHIGIIPDGNRRWAQVNNLPTSEGHKQGAKKMELFLKWALGQEPIREISVYGLSEENFKRSNEELTWLYDIYYKGLNKLLNNKVIHDEKIKVNFISTKTGKVPGNIIDVFGDLKSETKVYGNKILNILIGYTGQTEILRAVSTPMNRVKNLFFGLSEKDLQRQLMVKNPCDFVIRTGEEDAPREAKSGFLLWQSAYSEYYHLNKFWPDVTKTDLNVAWKYFMHTRRKKGI
ncbi:MAG: polyprenyl diphosphate synthase [Candidatus Diapherotrites archaeon]|nr:polyprenyl diphosphate synthase [Candidatus Diapherotrites archaeon]